MARQLVLLDSPNTDWHLDDATRTVDVFDVILLGARGHLAELGDAAGEAIDKGATVMIGGPDTIDEHCVQPTILTHVPENSLEMTDETWHLVKSTPKVTGFIGGSAMRPTPISDKEVENILHQVQEGVEKPKPKVLFEVGESVRVTEGPFTDFNGNVEEVNYEKSKIRVSVLIFGRATPVELDFGQVEKA